VGSVDRTESGADPLPGLLGAQCTTHISTLETTADKPAADKPRKIRTCGSRCNCG